MFIQKESKFYLKQISLFSLLIVQAFNIYAKDIDQDFSVETIPNSDYFSDEKVGFDDKEYTPKLELSFKFGNKRCLTRPGILVPVLQSPNNLMYFSGFGLLDTTSAVEGNFGLGYRTLLNDNIFGGYVFYDLRRSSRGNVIHQATLGAEWFKEYLEYRANIYLPTTHKHVFTKVLKQDYKDAGKHRVRIKSKLNEKFERALQGLDISIAGQHPQLLPLTTSATLYYFGFSQDVKKVTGARIASRFHLSDSILLEAEISYDTARKTTYFVGATWKWDFARDAKVSSKNHFTSKMTSLPVRDIDAVSNDATKVKVGNVLANLEGGKAITDIQVGEDSRITIIYFNDEGKVVSRVVSKDSTQEEKDKLQARLKRFDTVVSFNDENGNKSIMYGDKTFVSDDIFVCDAKGAPVGQTSQNNRNLAVSILEGVVGKMGANYSHLRLDTVSSEPVVKAQIQHQAAQSVYLQAKAKKEAQLQDLNQAKQVKAQVEAEHTALQDEYQKATQELSTARQLGRDFAVKLATQEATLALKTPHLKKLRTTRDVDLKKHNSSLLLSHKEEDLHRKTITNTNRDLALERLKPTTAANIAQIAHFESEIIRAQNKLQDAEGETKRLNGKIIQCSSVFESDEKDHAAIVSSVAQLVNDVAQKEQGKSRLEQTIANQKVRQQTVSIQLQAVNDKIQIQQRRYTSCEQISASTKSQLEGVESALAKIEEAL